MALALVKAGHKALTVNAYKVEIFIGTGTRGFDGALEICRQYCDDIGLCVTVEPLQFAYTGGHEPGVRIGLINYARFPASRHEIWSKARMLADKLLRGLGQGSYTLQDYENSYWYSERPNE